MKRIIYTLHTSIRFFVFIFCFSLMSILSENALFAAEREGKCDGQCNQADIEVLRDIVALNHLQISPLQLGKQKWRNGRLTRLTIGGDHHVIATLPKSIGNLTELKYLHLSNNQLQDVPNSIGKLNKLENLYLNDNQLSNLPLSIGKLAGLKNLYLNNNCIAHLPYSLGNLMKLKNLHVHDNPLSGGLPDSVIMLPNLDNLYY